MWDWCRKSAAGLRIRIESGLLGKALRMLRYGIPAVLVALLNLNVAVADAAVPVDLELVLAVDVSGSVDPTEAKLQRTGYVSALTHKHVLSAIRSGYLGRIAVAYVEWADSHRQSLVVDWTLIDGEKTARAFTEQLDAAPFLRGRFTSISAVIDFALPMFDNNGFEGTRRVIDVSGDGANNSGGLVNAARDAAVRAGVIINGLPIVNERPQRFGPQVANLDLYYRNCVIGGPGAFVVVARDFESFALAVRKKMVLEIAGDVPPRRLFMPVAEGQFTAKEPRKAPSCDAGERMLDQRLKHFFYLDN